MSTQQVNVSLSPSSRNLNNVQRVQRTMIWFGLFFLMGILTALLTLISWSIWAPLGVISLVIGGLLTLIVPGMISSCLYILSEFDRVIVLKLGKFVGVRGPGRFWVIPYPPFNESVAAQIDNRIHTRMIKAAETLTADNVPVGCEAVVFWRVEDPKKAALTVSNYHEAIFQAANSALKDTIGSLELSELLGERDKIANTLEHIIDRAAADFGVDITSVEITDVRVPPDLVQELSVLAQSRRSAEAKVAEAEAEKAIAEKLDEAAALMSDRALDMYRLNVLERIGREEGSQVVIYGMGSGNADLERSIVGGVAGSRQVNTPSEPKPASSL
jgi:regulator of protease activity HflC (stomatin/prohibitin superfamily)